MSAQLLRELAENVPSCPEVSVVSKRACEQRRSGEYRIVISLIKQIGLTQHPSSDSAPGREVHRVISPPVLLVPPLPRLVQYLVGRSEVEIWEMRH